VAQAQTLSTAKNTAKLITLNATDADGDALTYTLVTSPVHGVLSGTAPNLVYTPAAGYIGSDPFTFKASDGKGDSNTATISISVSDAAAVPVITTQPAPVTVTLGETATFSVTASSGTTITYQWMKNGSPISGATSSSYTTAATTNSDHGTVFTVRVRNAAGDTISQEALLTVEAPRTLDLNGDQTVDVLDLATLAGTYGTSASAPDLNGSGLVDDADITQWLAGF